MAIDTFLLTSTEYFNNLLKTTRQASLAQLTVHLDSPLYCQLGILLGEV